MSVQELPVMYKRIIGRKFTTKLREAVEVEEVALTKPGPNELLVRNRFVGVNAADVLITTGHKWFALRLTPYVLGFEALGTVVALGEGCPPLLGYHVMFFKLGAYSEYSLVNYNEATPVPTLDCNYLVLLVSGLTAAISLDKEGEMKAGDTVLVTAAAGGAGQIAVQWAKSKVCQVIGTCSTIEKAALLKRIGCDRPVVYTQEDLNTVLQTEYPSGVDVVFESVGGELFDAALSNLAMGARILQIGCITSYLDEHKEADSASCQKILFTLVHKAATIKGFQLYSEVKQFAKYIPQLVDLYQKGKISTSVDQGEQRAAGPFVGIDQIFDAMEYLYSKKSVGKVIVDLIGKE